MKINSLIPDNMHTLGFSFSQISHYRLMYDFSCYLNQKFILQKYLQNNAYPLYRMLDKINDSYLFILTNYSHVPSTVISANLFETNFELEKTYFYRINKNTLYDYFLVLYSFDNLLQDKIKQFLSNNPIIQGYKSITQKKARLSLNEQCEPMCNQQDYPFQKHTVPFREPNNLH